jgi:transmembrane sensor
MRGERGGSPPSDLLSFSLCSPPLSSFLLLWGFSRPACLFHGANLEPRMSNQPDWRALDRYLAGDASPDEERAVREWMAADLARAEVLRQLEAAHRPDGQQWNVDAAWSRFSARPKPATPRGATRYPLPATRGFRLPARIAAVLLLTAATYGTWRLVRPAGDPQVAMRELAAPNGQRATATLGDGSRVVLNAGSRLRYAADIARGSRDVHLDGEAYFEVTHDRARPFRVHARGGVAHDLGTRFTVRAYPELPRVEVVVAEGRVSLRRDQAAPTDSVILVPGQLGRLEASGAPSVVAGVDTAMFLGWVGGTLALDGLTLEEALPQLERRFDVDVRVEDRALASRRIYARFRDETLTQVLDALSLALSARYEHSGRIVTIHPAVSPSR